MLLEVYRCVQLKRWSVVCGCVLQRGQRGEGWCVSSTLCRYDIRMGLLLVLNWARVRRVSLGRESSEGEIIRSIVLHRQLNEFSPLSSFVIRCRFGDLIIHCRQPGRGGILLA